MVLHGLLVFVCATYQVGAQRQSLIQSRTASKLALVNGRQSLAPMSRRWTPPSRNRYAENIAAATKENKGMTSLSITSHKSPFIPRRRDMSTRSLPELTSSLLMSTPDRLFNTLFGGLTATALAIKFGDRQRQDANSDPSSTDDNDEKHRIRQFQRRFLLVFWLLRMADWLQGPYFYEVYASKILNGVPVTLNTVSRLFLAGFVTTGLLGPSIGRLVDSYGRKAGTLAYTLFYTLGALSTKALSFPILLAGRLAGGIGTSLLFCAPEAWLVGDHQKSKLPISSLGQTFGLAFAGDSIVAILAGQLAGIAASYRGPTGPFELSTVFLAAGAVAAATTWRENVATDTRVEGSTNASKPSIKEAWKMMLNDRRILLVGAIQALFEGAMYIFVMQWPPAMKAALAGAAVPYGKVFSCLMASCLIGASMFGSFAKREVPVEKSASLMLGAASVSMAAAAMSVASPLSPFAPLIAAFLVFEVCVGMYFPSIGTLRSKYVPDSHRSVMMNIYGIPLNLIVVAVFLSIQKIGVSGALTSATVALFGATAASIALRMPSNKNTEQPALET